MLSGPCLTFYISLICDGIVTICLIQIYDQIFTILAYMVINLFLVLYLSYLDHEQQNELSKMFYFIQNNYCQPMQDLPILSINTKQTNNIRIALQELKLYIPYFQLQLFRICTVNYSFVLSCTLFTFNMAVLAIQTSKQT